MNIKFFKHFLILSLAIAFIFILSPGASAEECNLLDSSFNVPDGFGASYDVLSNAEELLIKTNCGLTSVDIGIGKGSDFQYIYNKGYVYRNNNWEELTFSGDKNVGGGWLKGKAILNLAVSQEEFKESSAIIAYICTWTGRKWKCGCRDAACSNGHWQLQMFKKQETCPMDYDRDGYGDPASNECPYPELDCDDNNDSIHPNAKEVCDSIDNDCNGKIDDNCGCVSGSVQACGQDIGVCQFGTQTCINGSWSECEGGVMPTDEICDGKDNDCDGETDEGMDCCIDKDGDGYGTGEPGSTLPNCPNPEPDCDDTKWYMNPGAPETCDNYDNNCSEEIDEGCDDDDDGYCDSNIKIYNRPVAVCLSTNVANDSFGDDCDDENGKISPGASEICDSIDNNCDNIIDEGCLCQDGDTEICGTDVGECKTGIKTCVDGEWGECEGEIKPVEEVCADNKDNNCDGQIDEDCDVTPPQITNFDVQPRTTTDIITASYSVSDNQSLKQVELWRSIDLGGQPNPNSWTNIKTNTVSGTLASGSITDTPAMGVWWYGLHVIDQSGNWSAEPNPPGPIKVISESTKVCTDTDFDGYGVCPDCGTANGCTYDGDDCDDNEKWANPGGFETCDTVDNNCSGVADEGCDDDSDDYCDENMKVYRNNTMCANTPFIDGRDGDDCDDENNAVNPGKIEVCGNSIDDNCDSQVD